LRDNRHIVVMTVAGSANAFWRVALDGSATEQIIAPGAAGQGVTAGSFACAASPSGRTLVYPRQVGEYTQLMFFDLASGREQQLTRSPSQKYDATWSPDARWVTFATHSGGGINIWRIAAGGGTEEPLTEGVDRIRHSFYSRDSRWLYIQPNHRNIYRMPAGGGPREPVTTFPDTFSLFIEEPTITPDGRHLVYARDRSGASLWMFSLTGR
jgi:Tol biopolymer transport system component